MTDDPPTPKWTVLLEMAVIVSPCGANDDEKAAYPLMNKRQHVVTAHISDGQDIPTPKEMQRIMYAAKMEYGRICRERRPDPSLVLLCK